MTIKKREVDERTRGTTRVTARNDRYLVAFGKSKATGEERMLGDAKKALDGTWTVTKVQWEGANGCDEYGGFPGGPLVIGVIPASVSKGLGVRLVRAMLGQL